MRRFAPRVAPGGDASFAQILFHETDSSISLERNEIIALVNGLGKFTRTLRTAHFPTRAPAHHGAPRAAIGARVVLCELLRTLGHLCRRLLECAARHRGDAPS
jgi:hypothetical protein